MDTTEGFLIKRNLRRLLCGWREYKCIPRMNWVPVGETLGVSALDVGKKDVVIGV
jgi:hypothetical protein